MTAIEYPDVIQPQETAGEQVVALEIFAINPPREIHQALIERLFEEHAVAGLPRLVGKLVTARHRPCVAWRSNIPERQLVRRQLPVRMHVPLTAEQQQLVLRELWVEPSHCDTMKCEIPRREPRIFPAVRHRDHFARPQMIPSAIASAPSFGRWCRPRRIALKPMLDDVMIKLPRPHHTCIGLPNHTAFVRRHWRSPRRQMVVVCLTDSLVEQFV